jgi:sugar phosphate isomerase/epimerase
MVDDRLVLASNTLRHVPLLTQIDCAAGAGFTRIGISANGYRAARANGVRPEQVRRALDAAGVVVDEIDALVGWAKGDRDAARFEADESLLFELADTFGPPRMQVVPPWEHAWDQLVDEFGRVCDRAASHGLRVALEFLPQTAVPDSASAARLIGEAGSSNAGICLDVWHHFRGADDIGQLLALEPDQVAVIQLNDGTLRPRLADYRAETRASRVAPGDGEFPLVPLLRALADRGIHPHISVEVLSEAVVAADPADICRYIAHHAEAVIHAAGTGWAPGQ